MLLTHRENHNLPICMYLLLVPPMKVGMRDERKSVFILDSDAIAFG
ncbi:hypothetical protein [Nostoc sp. C057]|nr:hypothetical protein [Nostoc sp. C057]